MQHGWNCQTWGPLLGKRAAPEAGWGVLEVWLNKGSRLVEAEAAILASLECL